ncbi:MAG: DNA-protecting protein DprA [Alistipes sp.]|nr:DNA-protecting protein DprA [Alistipes sp.]
MPLESIALTFVPHLGVRGAAHLLECFGSARAIYESSAEELSSEAGLRVDIAQSIASKCGMREAEREVLYCQRHGITPVAYDSAQYPHLLRGTNDFPAVLYVMGDVSVLSRRAVGFVGTRKVTPYGQRMCNMLVGELAEVVPDALIVSGLAFGVDGEVHRAALINGLPTVGVLANTLPSVSPAAHRALAADIVSRGGALVTELNSQTKQNGNLYIPRNRIIAGISAGVVVVETPESGGSLSTAAFADGYGRSVMAVPGRATDNSSRGCNMLIRNRKAQAVMSGRDIASELMWELELTSEPAPQREKLPLTDQEQSLLVHFGQEPITIDALQVASGLSLGELSLLLMNLELSGAVRQLPGKQYEKLI